MAEAISMSIFWYLIAHEGDHDPHAPSDRCRRSSSAGGRRRHGTNTASAIPVSLHQSIDQREEPVSPTARAQPGRLVSVGGRGLRESTPREQAHLSVDRLLHLPLVPRDGSGD